MFGIRLCRHELIPHSLKFRNKAIAVKPAYFLKSDDIRLIVCKILKYLAFAFWCCRIKKKIRRHYPQVGFFELRKVLHDISFLDRDQRLKATSISFISASLIGTMVPFIAAISQRDSAPNSRTSRRS